MIVEGFYKIEPLGPSNKILVYVAPVDIAPGNLELWDREGRGEEVGEDDFNRMAPEFINAENWANALVKFKKAYA